jgi:hypothetical protein
MLSLHNGSKGIRGFFVSKDGDRASFTVIRQQKKSDLTAIAIIMLKDCHQSSGLYYKVFHCDVTLVFSLAMLP